jgi:hypothetical protein
MILELVLKLPIFQPSPIVVQTPKSVEVLASCMYVSSEFEENKDAYC